MSISNLLLGKKNKVRLIMPCGGKMFRSSIDKHDKVLCFVLNKGYLESSNLEDLYYVLMDVVNITEDFIWHVGAIDKIRLRNGSIVYRQRVFFKSLTQMCAFCKRRGVEMIIADSFEIDINNVMFCLDELKYLEYYARAFRQTIDKYLTNTCIIQFANLLKDKRMQSPVIDRAERLLEGKVGYLNRAPLLAGSYDIKKHTSAIYIPSSADDIRKYTESEWGYKESIVNKDREAGVFRKC